MRKRMQRFRRGKPGTVGETDLGSWASPREGRGIKGTTRVIVFSVIAVIGLTVGVLPSAADHGQPHVEMLARGTFVDEVAALFKVKVDGGRTHVHQADDASDVVVAKITIPDGARLSWHSHSGPVFGVNAGPGTLTSFHGDDCAMRQFPPGSALFDRGQHTLHGGFNNSGQ